MSLIQTIIISIVEGVTEFLPISSTGHLILTSHLLGLTQTEFMKSFEIIIQFGAILAVVAIYFKKLISNLDLSLNILAAFIPTALIGFLFYDFIKGNLIGNNWVVIVSLFIGGIAMLIFEYFIVKTKTRKLRTTDYLILGLFQSISVIPGVSRAFATIFGGMLLGMNRKNATEFSFLLAIPTMAGATALDLAKTDIFNWSSGQISTLTIGFITSFMVAFIVVKWLIKYIQTHDFKIFGWYRIAVAIIFTMIIFAK